MKDPAQNQWKVQPDTTVQVVHHMGLKQNKKYVSHRNWWGICISLAIIFTVLILVLIATIIIIPFRSPKVVGRRITLDDIADPVMRADPLCSQWLSESKLAYFSEDDGLVFFSTSNNTKQKYISKLTLQQIGVKEFSVSPNRHFVLLMHDVIEGRLYKKIAKYTIYDLQRNFYFPLKLDSEELEHPRYQFADWMNRSAGKSSASDLIVVHNNNIMIFEVPSGPLRIITKDGKRNEIYNGIPDDINEDILRRSSSVWSSPSGNLLAFLSFNDSSVNTTPLFKYDDKIKIIFLKYATVESSIPQVLVRIVDIESGVGTVLSPPFPISNSEYYVLGVGWVNDSKLWVSWVSRDQSTFLLSYCEGSNWTCSTVHINHHGDGISPTVENVVWSESWAAFPWPMHVSEALWHNHVAMMGLKGTYHPTLQLSGCHVERVLAADPDRGKIYFMGSEISEGTEKQQLYVLNIEKESLDCLSCPIGCPRVSVSLNPSLTHAVITCVNARIPSMFLISLVASSNFTIPLHRQPALSKLISDVALPISIYKDYVLSSSIHASVVMSIPPGYNEEDNSFLYPLIIHILGVENYLDQNVEHQLSWAELLASGNYIAHAKIRLWRNSQYSSTKTVAHNLLKVIRKLLEEYNYLDADQVSLWGWGSGASIALQLSTLDNFPFKCILAINPVSDWKKYNSYWAERFLGPLESPGAGRRYEESNLMGIVSSITSSMMLMTSGNDPMNHHSSYLSMALINNGIYFQQMVYPDSSMAVKEERIHVLKCMQKFFVRDECARIYHVTSLFL